MLQEFLSGRVYEKGDNDAYLQLCQLSALARRVDEPSLVLSWELIMWWLVLLAVCLLLAPIPTLILLPFILVGLVIVGLFSLLPASIRWVLAIVFVLWLLSRAPS